MKTVVVTKEGKIEIREINKPSYSAKQALVRTVSCGICNGTDAKLIHKTFKGFDDHKYPLMLGHEGVGEVVEVGRDVIGLHVGDKVLLPFVDAYEDTCRKLDSAWGAYSEYAVVDDVLAYENGSAPDSAYAQNVLPDWINPIDAAMIVTLREVISSIKRFGMKSNSSVAVFGCGPVGLTFIKFLSLLGAHPIIAFDIVDEKLKEAKERGADYAFNSSKADAAWEIKNICKQGVEFVLDAVGMLPLINASMEMLCDGGKMCCYGIAAKMEMRLDWSKAPYNWKLQFQQFPSKKEEGECHNQIIAWLRAGVIDLKDYISDYFDFDDVLTAFEKLEKREISKKGIIVYKKAD